MAGGGRSMLDDMVGVGDMVLLESLTEDGLIENLWDRYNNKDIYVSNDTNPALNHNHLEFCSHYMPNLCHYPYLTSL